MCVARLIWPRTQGTEAAKEFKKILDHRGIVVSDPIGALAHLQLGRAFVLSGDRTKAKSAYQDFLTLWKDADQDIPILKQAKAEYRQAAVSDWTSRPGRAAPATRAAPRAGEA
jgi:hypothetical protein